jgi:protocatechuate 3,4-dioxygenase beta subunit
VAGLATSTATVAPAATSCPMPSPGSVAPGSVLIPGPTEGLPATDAVGERMVIDAVVFDAHCTPAAGATATVWHTDARGRYRPDGATACCFYRGIVQTDQNGRFRLDSVRPGQYSVANAPPAHIHVELHHPSGGLLAEVLFTAQARPVAASPGASISIYLEKTGAGPNGYWYGEAGFILQSNTA